MSINKLALPKNPVCIFSQKQKRPRGKKVKKYPTILKLYISKINIITSGAKNV